MEIIQMTCRQCGGKLSISKEADQIICQNCGSEFLVFHNERTTSLKLISENISSIQLSSKNIEIEIALERLTKEETEIWENAWNLFIEVGKTIPLKPWKVNESAYQKQKGRYTYNPELLKEVLIYSQQNTKFLTNVRKEYLKNSLEKSKKFVQRTQEIEQEKNKLHTKISKS